MTTLSPSPRCSEPEPVWRDVDDDLFSAAAVLHHGASAARVQVIGDLCPTSAPVLRTMLDGLIADGIQSLVVDMTELRLCTSHGLDVLARAQAAISARGGSLSIEHPNTVVRKVLDLAGPDLTVTA